MLQYLPEVPASIGGEGSLLCIMVGHSNIARFLVHQVDGSQGQLSVDDADEVAAELVGTDVDPGIVETEIPISVTESSTDLVEGDPGISSRTGSKTAVAFQLASTFVGNQVHVQIHRAYQVGAP